LARIGNGPFLLKQRDCERLHKPCCETHRRVSNLSPHRFVTGREFTMTALLTKEDIAARLQVEPRTVYEMIRGDDGPPAIRVGRLIRFRPADVEKWIDGRPTVRVGAA
jgi:excisionase family DNA binding protein